MLRHCLQRPSLLSVRVSTTTTSRVWWPPRRPRSAPAIRGRNLSSSQKRVEEVHFMESPLTWYSHKLDTNPIITKCVSAGIIAGMGNLGAQRLIFKGGDDGNEQFQIDWPQMGRFALLNVVFVAPVLHYWYVGLEQAIPGKAIKAVLKRVFYDEFVFTPVYIPILMSILWTLEGVELQHLPRMIREEWFNVLIFDWSVYVPVQFLNFRYVPVKFQVLVINLVGVGWNCFVCWRAQGQQERQKEIKGREDAEAAAAKIEKSN